VEAYEATRQRHVEYLLSRISQIRDRFSEVSQGGVVRLRRDGAGVLDYSLGDYLRDGIRSSYLAMAECQFAAGVASVHPASSDARAYRSWAEAPAGISSMRVRASSVHVNSTHPLGSCAMGADTSTAVLRADGRRHHVDDLSFIDGSLFPRSLGADLCEAIRALAACSEMVPAERFAKRRHEPRTAGAA
jgi:choline dehydrogenase-like flavoprotein